MSTNTSKIVKLWMLGLAMAFMFTQVTAVRAATPVAWKGTGFSINADDMSLRGVLEEFGRIYGVGLSLEINAGQSMHGRLKAESGADFLNRLSQTYNFRWFVFNETLYVVPGNDNTSMRMEVGEDAVQDAKTALIGVGLFDERFGWGELPDTGTVIVSGPRAYVQLARDILMPDEKHANLKTKQIMIFRLRYASATDRVINARGQQETIPGVKTILTSLLNSQSGLGSHMSGGSGTGSGGFDAGSHKRSRTAKVGPGEARETSGGNFNASDTPGSKGTFVPLFSSPLASGGKLASRDSSTNFGGNGNSSNSNSNAVSSSGSESSGDSKPRIEANPSLNAIMIYDYLSKRSMYASLISQLDIQPQQIEIEALIVDIDRSKMSELGVEWGATAGAVNATMNATTSDSSGVSLPLPGSTLLINNASRFYARLKAMESNGDAKVLATPSILTLDNVAAVLDLSQSAYVSLVGERVADLADITAGTMLRVIPRIIHDGADTKVHLEVDIEDGSIDNPNATSSSSSSSTSNNAQNISVTRSTISTQAIIDAQQTLMIGGYRVERLSHDRQKVPLLGDIPIVGGLFRSDSQSRSTKERFFMLTPHLTGTRPTVTETTSTGRRRGYSEAAKSSSSASDIRDAYGTKTLADSGRPNTISGATDAALTGPMQYTPPARSTPAPVMSSGGQLLPAPAGTVQGRQAPMPPPMASRSVQPAPVSYATPVSPQAGGDTTTTPKRVRVRCARPKGWAMLPASVGSPMLALQ